MARTGRRTPRITSSAASCSIRLEEVRLGVKAAVDRLDRDIGTVGELVVRHHHWMLRLVRQLSVGERDPEAVVQDADVIRGAAAFRGDGPVRGWLAAIVRRRVCAVAGTTTKGVVGRPQMWTYRARRPTQFLGDAVTGIALCPGRRQSVCVHRAHNLSSLAILTDVALGVHG